MVTIIPRQRFTDLRALSLHLQLGNFAAQILGWGFFEPRWWRNYLHVHSFFEVCYAYAGNGTFQINGVIYPVRAGEVFIARPAEPHEIISSETDPLGIYFWSYTLVPPQSNVPASPIDALLHAFFTTPQWVSADVPSMERTLEMLTEEIALKEIGYAESVRGLVVKLLLDTARAVTPLSLPEESPAHSPTETIVKDIARYLRDNYSHPVMVRDVAAQVHLSERHTNRLFRQVMGVSIKDYLTDFRLGVAKQLLVNRQLGVSEVAYATGYRDVRHFITIFRQRTGFTPAAFREKGGTVFLES
jgi:AraC-like DNA-binding protein